MSKLVIIDDDPFDHFLMQHLLQDNKSFDKTTYTMDGSLVLDYIAENKSHPDALPDVILLDLHMPKFNGWAFLDGLQQFYNQLNKNIKVYVLTSSVRPEDRDRAAQYSFIKSLINKPLQTSILEEINQEALC
jgi:CheY-like chemotaxis protein